MTKERLDLVIKALNEKGVKLPCPRCGKKEFSIVEESVVLLQPDPEAFTIGGPSIPVIIVVCNHCGYITSHAKKVLGI